MPLLSSSTTPEEQLRDIWDAVKQHNLLKQQEKQQQHHKEQQQQRQWPGFDQVQSGIRSADYNETLQCPMDLKPKDAKNPTKTLCPFGVLAKTRLELFPCPASERPYTGLLSPNATLDHCLIRLSSAMKPPGAGKQSLLSRTLLRATGEKLRAAKLFPACAIKIFRDRNNSTTKSSSSSGNMLFIGSKVGQRETDYFAHCQCTQATEQMPSLVRPLVQKFFQYSENPLALGVSDLCWTNLDGSAVEPEDLNFPYCLILHPRHASPPAAQHHGKDNSNEDEDLRVDAFLDDMMETIPAGTHLFDLYASPSPQSVPNPSALQRIGRIITTSDMMISSPDDGLFFKHQLKEEDFTWRPDWKAASQATQCSLNDGKTGGSVERLAGWKLFEHVIAQGRYVDYEKPQHDIP